MTINALLLPLLLQSTALPTIDELRLTECVDMAFRDPPSAIVEGSKWRQENGGWRADICLANGFAQNFEFPRAIPLFESGAEAASVIDQDRANRYWLQAGNAAIAADRPRDAIRLIDRALAKGALDPEARGEALIDRARAYVASGQNAQAKVDLFAVRRLLPENILGWLFSATLARRDGEMEDAQTFIAAAAAIAPQDPAVALEAGNIAAQLGDTGAAATHWQTVIDLAPGSRQAQTARARLNPATPQPAQPE